MYTEGKVLLTEGKVLLTEVSCEMYASWETYHQHKLAAVIQLHKLLDHDITYYNGYRWRLCSAEVTIVYTHNRGWIEMWMDGFMISASKTKEIFENVTLCIATMLPYKDENYFL